MLVILGDSRKLKFHNFALQEIHLRRKVLQSDSQLSRDLTSIPSINWQFRLVYTKVHLFSHSRSKLRGGSRNRADAATRGEFTSASRFCPRTINNKSGTKSSRFNGGESSFRCSYETLSMYASPIPIGF